MFSFRMGARGNLVKKLKKNPMYRKNYLDESYAGPYFLRHGYHGHPFPTKLKPGVQWAPRLNIPKFQIFLKFPGMF